MVQREKCRGEVCILRGYHVNPSDGMPLDKLPLGGIYIQSNYLPPRGEDEADDVVYFLVFVVIVFI